MSKRIVTVFGATGQQGGSVVEALLKDGNYKVRAVTRKPEDEKAKALLRFGVEVVKGDISGSTESLAEVLKGSYGAFLLTNFWDPSSSMKEADHGKHLVDAAHKAGVKHIVWSTLANVEKESKGKYTVPHFTDKAKVEEYIRELQSRTPKAFEHATFVAPAFYYQNFLSFFPPRKDGDTEVFTFPKIAGPLIAFDVCETGPSVVTAFNNPSKWDLRRIDYYGESAPIQKYVDAYSQITGRKARLDTLSLEAYGKLAFPGAHELAEMFGWFSEYTYYGAKGDANSGQEATPGGLSNYETFLRRTNQA